LRRAWKQLRWSVTKRGLRGTLWKLMGRLHRREDEKPAVHPFDLEHGVETSGLIGGGQIGTGHEHDRYVVGYYGVQPSRLYSAVTLWGRAVREYAFVDFGAGKGRAMMIAAAMGFREVLGVELDEELAATGERNLRLWEAAGKARCAMRLVHGDVLDVPLPDGPVFLFLYNPFGAVVMRRLLERLVGEGREMDLVYMVPEQAMVFAEFAEIELVWSEVISMSEEDAAADWVSTSEDRCNLYRLKAKAQS